MEYNLGLWSQDLTPIARLMEEENEDFLTLKWRDGESGDMFFSLLFSPCGYVVFELVSDTLDIEGIDVWSIRTQGFLDIARFYNFFGTHPNQNFWKMQYHDQEQLNNFRKSQTVTH